MFRFGEFRKLVSKRSLLSGFREEYSVGRKRQVMHSNSPMKKLTLTICLTLAVLLGSLGCSGGADFDKGLAAAKSGDFATALREWRPLAEDGHAKSQYNLGVQDDVYAHMWFNIAAASGDKEASTNRDIVAKQMTATQIEKAEKLASECIAKEYKEC
jgi:hypothetical protein